MTALAYSHIFRRPVVFSSFLALIISAALLAGFVSLSWYPTSLAVEKAEASIVTLRAELSRLDRTDQLLKQYQNRHSQVERLEQKLRAPSDDPEFIANLEKLAASANVQIQQFSSQLARQNEAHIKTANFEFSLTGRYASLKRFLFQLQSLPELISVEQVLIETAADDLRGRIVFKRMSQQ